LIPQSTQGSLFPLDPPPDPSPWEAGSRNDPLPREAGGHEPSPARRQCIGVTVRTPAGAGSAFAVEWGDEAYMLTERAIGHFVGLQLLEPGAFRLGLRRGDTLVDLAPDAVLLAQGLVEGDVLHLISTQPQVDALVGRSAGVRT
jgi:hypothetical protein